MAKIPLRRRDGTVRAWTIVDDADLGWLNQWNWRLHSKGYAAREESGRTILMHRLILGLQHGDPTQGDHWDRDRLNNRRRNLRPVSEAQNPQNTSARPGTSSHRGVSWDNDRGRWLAQISVAGKKVNLGRFRTEDQAAEAARLARTEFFTHSVD